jgi:tRNA nucleotidyltransferase (CCA-adding enzyme)
MSSLLDRLADPTRTLVLQCGDLAAARGYDAYLVGGAVRDLLLGVESPDIDILVVGDALAVAQDFSRARAGQLKSHYAFHTATVELPEGTRVDFATARSESYERRASLPRVEPGTLEDDLGRRDFTINTLALAVHPAGPPGELVDLFDGVADIEKGVVRFLHEQSFSDDPTRVLRALRFSLRLGYRFARRTEAGMADAARGCYLADLSADRLRRELGKLLAEQPVDGPLELHRRDFLKDIHAGLRADERALRNLASLVPDAETATQEWATLAVMAAGLAPQERWDLIKRLRLPRREQRTLIDAGEPWDGVLSRFEALDEPTPGQAGALFDELVPGAVAAGAATGTRDDVLAAVARYLQTDRGIRPALDGVALLELGCPEGPRVRSLMTALTQARRDGLVCDAAAERDWARSWLQDRN